jgi:hypothetical protein
MSRFQLLIFRVIQFLGFLKANKKAEKGINTLVLQDKTGHGEGEGGGREDS